MSVNSFFWKLKTLVPVMSAGMRSGVNWMRENSQPSTCASVRTSSVFATPGTPSISACWPMKNGDERLVDDLALADDDLAHFSPDGLEQVGELFKILLHKFLARRGWLISRSKWYDSTIWCWPWRFR